MKDGPVDTFAKDNLPPAELMPEFDFSHPAYRYGERLNCVHAFLDRWVEEGRGDAPCFITPDATMSYAQAFAAVNRLAHVLVDEFGLVSGNRVLLRAANNPMMVIAYLAVIKAGGIAVGTMPLLRASELKTIIEKAEIRIALCDARLGDEMRKCQAATPMLESIGWFHGADDGGIEKLMAAKPDTFKTHDSRSDECCLIAFTSGTTGKPKGTMHFHRDMLAICDGFSALVLKPDASDIFCGSPPLAFTFGLGGLALFSMHAGAATLLLEQAPPDKLAEAIARHKATICFTAPTAYRVMCNSVEDAALSSLRKAVSAGEHLPLATFEAFRNKTGIKLIDGLGSTEMLHIFITSADDTVRPGATGIPVPGYSARIVDDDGRELSRGEPGKLAVKGPTGCRYLADERQSVYVQNGWNLTGDIMTQDEDGYFWYQARADDMIISAGYNISGPEVENCLLTHEAVAECGVIGESDEDRGQVIKAFVVLKAGFEANDDTVKNLQDHAKASIAPYKYPRRIVFCDELPKTQTGKLQRFRLKQADRDAPQP